MKEIQAFYKPDRTARAFWMGRLEKEYPVEVLQVGGKKLSKALIRTQKGVLMFTIGFALGQGSCAMAREHKPSKWDGVMPENYDALCKYQFRLTFPKYVRVEINSRMGDDLTQEMEALVWEARAKGMDVPQASRLFKNGLRRFICKVSGWKHGYIKREKRNYWRQMELSNTLSDSTEWDGESEHLNVQLYRHLGIEGDL